MTSPLQKKALAATKFLIWKKSVLDNNDLSDVDDLPALVEREFDDDNLSVDSDTSVFASEENSFFPELAAPAITSSEGEVATSLVGQDNYKLNPNIFLQIQHAALTWVVVMLECLM